MVRISVLNDTLKVRVAALRSRVWTRGRREPAISEGHLRAAFLFSRVWEQQTDLPPPRLPPTAGDVQRGEAWQAPGPRSPGVQGRDQVPPGHAEARYVSGTETPRSIVVGRLSRFRVNQSLTRASPLSPQVTSTSSNTLTTTGLARLLWSSTGASTSAVSSGTSHARSRPLLENRVLPLQCGGAFAGKSRSRSRCRGKLTSSPPPLITAPVTISLTRTSRTGSAVSFPRVSSA